MLATAQPQSSHCKRPRHVSHVFFRTPSPPHHNLDDHTGAGVVADAGAVQLRAVPILELDWVAADLVAAPARWQGAGCGGWESVSEVQVIQWPRKKPPAVWSMLH